MKTGVIERVANLKGGGPSRIITKKTGMTGKIDSETSSE